LGADYIRAHTSSEERIFAFPHCPIYHMADRLPASYYHQLAYKHAEPWIEQQIISDLEELETRYVIYLARSEDPMEYGFLSPYLEENYHIEATFLENDRILHILRRNKQ